MKTDDQMPLCPVVFGDAGQLQFLRWLRLQKSARQVLPIRSGFAFDEVLRAGGIWWRSPLHYKGLLAMWAFEHKRRPVVVCDTDWFPLTPIPFESYADAAISMCPDPGNRQHEVLDGHEHNSGLLVITQSVWDTYLEVWMDPGFRERYGHIDYADQIATTRTWEILGGALMPEEWNQSHWRKWPQRYSIHFHGRQGKKKMENFINEL